MNTVSLLLLAAHCDDGELWAGGTIARLTAVQKRVVLAIAHHDETRRGEAEAGTAVLGCEVRFRQQEIDLPEWIRACLIETQPEVIATHAMGDPHFEHNELGSLVNMVLTKLKDRKAYPIRWYWFDTYYSTETKGFPVLFDISGYFDQKRAALECHRSQDPEQLVQMARTVNALHGQRIRADYAEAFYAFPLLGKWPRLRDLP